MSNAGPLRCTQYSYVKVLGENPAWKHQKKMSFFLAQSAGEKMVKLVEKG